MSTWTGSSRFLSDEAMLKPVVRPAFGYGRLAPIERPMTIERATRMPTLEPLQTADLRDYQVEGVRWLAGKHFALLADEMRLGKTAQILRALPKRASVIVLCPAIVQLVWRDEILKWRPDLMPIVGPLEQPAQGEVVICSYDSLPDSPNGWQMRLLAAPLHETILILDECHYLKTGGALRTSRARKLGRQVGKVWGITGTPLVGRPADLWGVLTSCRLDAEVGEYRDFKAAFASDGAVAPWLKRKLKCVMLRRLRSEVRKELPPKQIVHVPVEAPVDLRNFLDAVDARWALIGHGDLPPFELLSEARKALASSRIEATKKFVKSLLAEGEAVVVFSAHRDPVLAMGSLPRSGVIVGETSAADREMLIERFQKTRELDVLALSMEAGGVGINLSRANVVVEVDLSWTPGDNAQAEDRVVSVEKSDPITVYRLVSDHPLDQRVLEILEGKERLIHEALSDSGLEGSSGEEESEGKEEGRLDTARA